MILQNQWEELILTGIELSSYKNVGQLLERIADDSIKILSCQGASIYIHEGNHLNFMITKNTVMEKKMGSLNPIFQKYAIPLSNESISGYVALSHEYLNIEDVYEISTEKPYQFQKNFDLLSNYKTISMLTMPMLDNKNDLIGVIQLINKYDEAGIRKFSDEDIFIAKYLCSVAAIAIKNTSFNELLKQSYFDTVYKLATASEFRDLETSFHIKRMSEMAALLWKNLGYSEEAVEEIQYAAQMHDIGKLGIPDNILQKPGILTPEERKIMETHTSIGAKILEGSISPLLKLSRSIAMTHHEKWDGTGYPNRLKGEKIPLAGRVTAIADVFDALVSKRIYKPAYSIEKVFRMIFEQRGHHFDPKVVDLFFDTLPGILEIYEKYKE